MFLQYNKQISERILHITSFKSTTQRHKADNYWHTVTVHIAIVLMADLLYFVKSQDHLRHLISAQLSAQLQILF